MNFFAPMKPIPNKQHMQMNAIHTILFRLYAKKQERFSFLYKYARRLHKHCVTKYCTYSSDEWGFQQQSLFSTGTIANVSLKIWTLNLGDARSSDLKMNEDLLQQWF